MQKLAEHNGGKCLSAAYVDSVTKLKWECNKGHQWKTTPANIISGTWCPKCNTRKKMTIAEMKKIAALRGGKCLSNVYNNNQTKLQWQCDKGHKWMATAHGIKSSQWCPYCAGKIKTILDMQKIARERGGKCLSKKYINGSTLLKWQCQNGHQWMAMPKYVIHENTWCRKCMQDKKRNSQKKKQAAEK